MTWRRFKVKVEIAIYRRVEDVIQAIWPNNGFFTGLRLFVCLFNSLKSDKTREASLCECVSTHICVFVIVCVTKLSLLEFALLCYQWSSLRCCDWGNCGVCCWVCEGEGTWFGWGQLLSLPVFVCVFCVWEIFVMCVCTAKKKACMHDAHIFVSHHVLPAPDLIQQRETFR